MNIQTPTVTATTVWQQALHTSPVDLARQESGKQIVLDENEFKYLQKVKERFTTGTVIFLPLDEKFLHESDLTKEKVIDLWKRLNKSEPDQKHTKTIKQSKKKPLIDLTQLPITCSKFNKVCRFLTEGKKFKPSPEKLVHSRVVAIDPTRKITKFSMPQPLAWETEENRMLVYPLLDQFIDGMPPVEFTASTSPKASLKGWSLWTTAEPGVAVATLCVQSQRIAHTMAECLKAHNIKAKVSQEKNSIKSHIAICIVTHSYPNPQIIKVANEALVKEYKRLFPDNKTTLEEAQIRLSTFSLSPFLHTSEDK